MEQSNSKAPEGDNKLRELLALIESDNLPATTPEEVEQLLQAGVPHALKSHLEVIIGGANEKTRVYAADRWLDRAGISAVTKVAVHKKISIDPRTLEALSRIAKEDEGIIDVAYSELRAELGEANGDGLGGDKGGAEGKVQEVVILPLQSSAGEPGPDAGVPSEAMLRDPMAGGATEVAGGAASAPKDQHSDPIQADLALDPNPRSS